MPSMSQRPLGRPASQGSASRDAPGPPAPRPQGLFSRRSLVRRRPHPSPTGFPLPGRAGRRVERSDGHGLRQDPADSAGGPARAGITQVTFPRGDRVRSRPPG